MTHTHSVAGDVFRMLGSIGCAPASLNDVSMVPLFTSYWSFLKYIIIAITEETRPKQHKTYTGLHKYIGIAITENKDQGKLAQSNISLTLEYINILA